MQTNRAIAEPITVRPYYRQKLIEYAVANPADGLMLLPALAREPRFYKGVWILDVQTGAKAMTLTPTSSCGASSTSNTYIHELVHVTVRGPGRTAFLVSYFG